jgi:hypothetical protein
MDNSPDEAVPWSNAAAAAPLHEDVLKLRVLAADAPTGPVRTARAVAADLLRHGPPAALIPCVFGVSLLVGLCLLGPARTVVEQESVQSADAGQAAKKVAEELAERKTDDSAARAAQSPRPKDAAVPGETQTRLDAAKAQISAASGKAPAMVQPSPPKSTEKPSGLSERLDLIGRKIAALSAAAPVTDHPPVARKRTNGGRGDAFDPSRNPNAPKD